jgi:hypothetical protein
MCHQEEEQLLMTFDDEVETVPTYRLPFASVKRFYTLLEAHGVFIRNRSDGRSLMYEALSTPATIALEQQDTRVEISRLSCHVDKHSHARIELLEKHLLALHALLTHVMRYNTVKSTFMLT